MAINRRMILISRTLPDLSQKYGILFVIPDNGDSVYPVTQLKDRLSDMSVLNALEKEIEKKYQQVSVSFFFLTVSGKAL
jgi:hypothetical protein